MLKYIVPNQLHSILIRIVFILHSATWWTCIVTEQIYIVLNQVHNEKLSFPYVFVKKTLLQIDSLSDPFGSHNPPAGKKNYNHSKGAFDVQSLLGSIPREACLRLKRKWFSDEGSSHTEMSPASRSQNTKWASVCSREDKAAYSNWRSRSWSLCKTVF